MKAFNRMASLLCVFLVIFVLFSGVAAAGDSVSIPSTTGSTGIQEFNSQYIVEKEPVINHNGIYISLSMIGWHDY